MCLDICEKAGGSLRRRLNLISGSDQIHVAFLGVWKGIRFRAISTLRREDMGIRSSDSSNIWIIRVGTMSALLRIAGPRFPFCDIERRFLALGEDAHTNSFSSARFQFLSHHHRTFIW